jgi:hypothetical protein
MALQSSGPIRMSQINTELNRSSTATISLDTAENGGYGAINTCGSPRPSSSNPATMSEWYGYNHSALCFPSGLIAGYNASSYPGSGTSWNDISGNGRTMTLLNPDLSTYGGFVSRAASDFQIPGSAGLYSALGSGSEFTMIIRAQWTTDYQDLTGLFWSEDSGKNFLIGMWYPHTGSNFVPRVDSCCTYMASWNAGQPASNTGPSPSQASFNWTDYCNSPMIIIRKTSTDVIKFHGMNFDTIGNQTTPVYLWQSNPFSDWGIGNVNQPIHVMCRSQGNYYASAYLHSVYIWNRQLSDAECKQVFDFEYPTYYPC